MVKISMDQQKLKKKGSSSYDYNLTFLTPTTVALFDMLPKEEKMLLKASPSSDPNPHRKALFH